MTGTGYEATIQTRYVGRSLAVHGSRHIRSTAGNSETLGNPNEDNPSSVNPQVRSVQIDFANSDDWCSAFPTTGSMLLPGATHLIDNSSAATIADMAFNHIGRDVNGSLMPQEYKAVDNGRMPVFDVDNKYHRKAADSPQAVYQGVEGLPWGS